MSSSSLIGLVWRPVESMRFNYRLLLTLYKDLQAEVYVAGDELLVGPVRPHLEPGHVQRRGNVHILYKQYHVEHSPRVKKTSNFKI